MSKTLTLFEPETTNLSNVHIGQSRSVSGRLARSPDDSFIKFPQYYGRHTTLAGIWMFLQKDHKREYLVTAFGKRKGSTLDSPAQFYGLHVSHGTGDDVNFSPSCVDYYQKHVTSIDNAEVLVIHNHPRDAVKNLLSQIMYRGPLPSSTDRETMYQFKYEIIVRWLASGNFQNVRFFVVESGALREILMPPANRLVNMLRDLTIQARV